LGEAELNELADDMLEHGQREPIWLYDGKILDGRNRYRACLLKGINPHIMETRVADPVAFVTSANLHRRHLDPGQRAMIAAKLATLKQGARTDLAPAVAMSDADPATAMNVSERSVERREDRPARRHRRACARRRAGRGLGFGCGGICRDHQPATQNEYIAHADSVAEAVKTAIAEMKAAESAIPNRASGDVKEKADMATRPPRKTAAKQSVDCQPTRRAPGPWQAMRSFVTPMATASR
jgi:hypothetical protein